MTDIPEVLRIEEYRALRATIRERGSLRLIVTALTFSAWAIAILMVCAFFVVPIFSLVPLAVLAAGFEVSWATHVGVERIGRYIQAHHEPASAGQARWERSAMAFSLPSGAASPVFPALYLGAAGLNLLLGTLFSLDVGASTLAENPAEILPVAALHLAFVLRVVLAIRYSGTQRAADFREFERLLKAEDRQHPNS